MKKILLILNALSFLVMQYVMAIELTDGRLELGLLIGSLAICFVTGFIVFRHEWNPAQLASSHDYLKSYRALSSALFILLFGSQILLRMGWVPDDFDLLKWLVWACFYFMLVMPVFTRIFSSSQKTEDFIPS